MYDIYEEIIDLTRRRGFIWPTSECYGSVAGFIDYGPLGAMLKRRVEDLWRSFYVYQEGYYEIECPTIAQESVFIGSGHVKEFADKMVQCPHCKEFLRADHIAEAHKTPNAQTMSSEILARTLMSLPCPSCEKIRYKPRNNVKITYLKLKAGLKYIMKNWLCKVIKYPDSMDF